jgi:hypothetical protein
MALGPSLRFVVLVIGSLSLVAPGGVIQDPIGTRWGYSGPLLMFFAVLRWAVINVLAIEGSWTGAGHAARLPPNEGGFMRTPNPGSDPHPDRTDDEEPARSMLVKYHFAGTCGEFVPRITVHRAGSTGRAGGHALVMRLRAISGSSIGQRRGAAMSASSGEKRRRKRDRQFLEFYDTLSLRATVAGVGGSIALLLFVVARSVFSS